MLCRGSKRWSPFSWTVYLSCYQWKKWWNRIHGRTPVGWDTDSECIWLQAAPKKRRSSGSKEPGDSSLTFSRDFCRRARNQAGEYGEPPFRRDSRNRWQSEEKEMSVCTRRPSCPEGKRPRASKRQIAEQISVLFLLKLKSVISALSADKLSAGKLSLGRGNIWKVTAAQRSFWDWCSRLVHGYLSEVVQPTPKHSGPPCHWLGAEDETNFLLVEGTHGARLNAPLGRRPGAHAYGYPLLWRAAADNSRNSHLKSTPTGHCRTDTDALPWQATAEQFFFSKFNMLIMFVFALSATPTTPAHTVQ